MISKLVRLLLTALVAISFAWPANATWSIIVVNRRTGEVAIASATCIPMGDLIRGLPMVRVGKGAGAMQAFSGFEQGLVIMYDMLADDADPADILAAVIAADSQPQTRQIGVVGMTGAPVNFTGSRAGVAKGGVVGEVGDLAYAIQGNVLTGASVWLAAEDALLDTPGDLSQKLMASMQAARAEGGDGRCSCDENKPTMCGAPPPSFTKSAHIGFMIVARIGDPDVPCTNGFDCASPNNYYLSFNVKGGKAQVNDPDPVAQLQVKYRKWRKALLGLPDALLSRVESVTSLPADGTTKRSVTVRMIDVNGNELTTGGSTLTVTTVDGSPALATPGPVVDHGDGTYSFELTAGTQPGLDRFAIRATTGTSAVTLYPYLEVRSDPAELLHVGFDEVSASRRTRVPLVVNAPGRPSSRYLIVASLSGTTPGTHAGDLFLPLNPPLISVYRHGVDSERLPGTFGLLDESGRAEGSFVSAPRFASMLVGGRIDWAAIVFGGDGRVSSEAVGFDVVP